MTEEYTGFNGRSIRTDVYQRINLIHSLFVKGATSQCNVMFSELLRHLNAVLIEDVRISRNPALTDWRLEQLSGCIQSQVETLNLRSNTQWMNVPELVADWSSDPVHLTVAGKGNQGSLFGVTLLQA